MQICKVPSGTLVALKPRVLCAWLWEKNNWMLAATLLNPIPLERLHLHSSLHTLRTSAGSKVIQPITSLLPNSALMFFFWSRMYIFSA